MNTGFKSQLKDVLSDAVSYFQDSGDPNAACVKAANEAGFNQDQADRLVETFNTARVICHYKAAEDKTSSCSLADKTVVRKQLKKEAKSEKSAEYNTADYGCYKQAEIDYVVPEVKIAAAELKEEPISKEAADWLAIREANTVRELTKSALDEARAANAMADEIAEKVAMQLSRNVSIDDVHDRMARIVTAYALDDRYAPGVEKVAEFLPAASDPDISLLRKYAAMHVINTDDLQDVIPAIKEAADFAAESAALEAYAREMQKVAQATPDPLDINALPDDSDKLESLLQKERIISERARRADLARRAELDPTTALKKKEKPSDGGSKAKSIEGVSPFSFMASLQDIARSATDEAAQARINKATDSVNNLRRQLILQNLLTTDKILSQEDPTAVAAAFRSINQISPDTTLNKEVLRGMLRSVVQSVAISPYDAKTLADVDKSRHAAYDPKPAATGAK